MSTEAQTFRTLLEWERNKRKVAGGGFEAFCNAFGYELAPHHRLLASKLERTITEPGYNLAVSWPPGHAKSTYASVLFPAYYMAVCPKKSVITASHTLPLAEDFGRATKRIISDPMYEHMMGSRLLLDSRSAARFELSNGARYYGVGVEGSVTGRRLDLGIIDDPLKGIEEAYSELQRNKAWNWYLSDFCSRIRPGASKIVIMTRWHEDDLIGRILASPNAPKWDVINLPAIAEKDDVLGRKIGEPLWPDYFTEETLLDLKSIMPPHVWEALYQGHPTMEQGDYFKLEDIQYIPSLPPNLTYYGGSDYAVSHGDGDYTVHAILGHDPKHDSFYIVDIWREKVASDVWVDSFLDLAKEYDVVAWAEEGGQIIKGVGPFIDMEAARRNQYVFRKQFTSSTDKTVRALSFRFLMKRKKLWILKAPWNRELEKELLSFPAGKYDDQVDALGIIARMLKDMNIYVDIPKKLEMDDFRSNMLVLPGLDADLKDKRKNAFSRI